MSPVFRHDAVTLHSETREENFESFMKEELIPYFDERYSSPTRVSMAILESQSFLKDTGGQRKYLWITTWDGSSESVRGSAFENARMIRTEETEVMLKKLESFGERSSEQIYGELVGTEVATDT